MILRKKLIIKLLPTILYKNNLIFCKKKIKVKILSNKLKSLLIKFHKSNLSKL